MGTVILKRMAADLTILYLHYQFYPYFGIALLYSLIYLSGFF